MYFASVSLSLLLVFLSLASPHCKNVSRKQKHVHMVATVSLGPRTVPSTQQMLTYLFNKWVLRKIKCAFFILTHYFLFLILHNCWWHLSHGWHIFHNVKCLMKGQGATGQSFYVSAWRCGEWPGRQLLSNSKRKNGWKREWKSKHYSLLRSGGSWKSRGTNNPSCPWALLEGGFLEFGA